MKIEINRVYRTAEGCDVLINEKKRITGNYRGVSTNQKSVYGWWREDGTFNTNLKNRVLILDVTEEYPEYLL